MTRELSRSEVEIVRRALFDLRGKCAQEMADAATRYDIKAVARLVNDHENIQAIIDILLPPDVIVTIVRL